MHRWRPAVLLAGLFAAPVAADGQVRSGGFVARQDGKEISRERYRFNGSTLEAEVEVVGRGIRLSTRTEFTPALSPVRYHFAAFGGGGRAPLEGVDAAFGDSVNWSGRRAGLAPAGVASINRPYAVMDDPAISHLATILLRYSRPTGGVQVLDVWSPVDGRVRQVRMQFRGDSGTVEMGGTTMRVTTDRDGWLRSASVASQRLTITWQGEVTIGAATGPGADTMPPAGVRESAFPVFSGPVRLGGTLTLPAEGRGRVPLAVIVPGPGGIDRNGNAPRGLRANTYAQLAWRLAERGIASARFDPRGAGETRGGPGPESPTIDDFAADLAEVVRAAAPDPRFGPVVVIGHSEGGLFALRAAEQALPVAGIALLGTPSRPFTRSFAGFDPAAAMARVRVPVLVVHGSADEQVALRDAQRLRAGPRPAQLAIIPQAMHLFKAAAGPERLVRLALYQDPTVPIVPELVTTLSTWINGLTRP